MAYEWKDKVVLITGAATGIGSCVVNIIAGEGVKHIAVLDIAKAAGEAQQNELNKKYGANLVKFYYCDVTDDDLLLGIFKKVYDEQGYIDVVVNNAGVMNDSPKIYKKAIQINVMATITSTLKAYELMRKDKGGRGGTIINVASVAALVQSPMLPIYYGTKAAVLMFSNCIGLNDYYSKSNVRVLTICFGATATPLATREKLGHFDEDVDEDLMNIIGTFPMQPPEAAAKGVVECFKCGESGSTWLANSSRPVEEITHLVKKAYGAYHDKVFS